MSSENAPEGKPEDLPADSHPAVDGERPGRRRSSLIVVSVAAAVLVAGGGGAYWATTSSQDVGTTGADGGPPPLQLDGYGKQESSDSRDAGVAPGEPNPGGPAFRATGPLPEGPGSAKVYRPAPEVTRADVERLAKALDVAGKPKLVGGSWKLGEQPDGSGPVLTVNSKAPGIWTYTRHAVGGCSEPSTSGPKGSEDDGASSSRCPAPGELHSEPSDGSVKPVSEQEAERVAGPVLEAAGVGRADVDASRTAGAVRTVSADPEVDGLPTYGLTTGLQVGADGNVVSGNGRLGELIAGPEYPVNNAEETLKRLNASRGGGEVGIGGCASAMPDAAVASDKTQKGDPCASEGKNKREPAKVSKATFGLAVQFVEGKQALVPSWLFEVELPGATGPQTTFTVTHPAVKPQYIARPEQGGEQPGREQGTKPGAGKADVTSYSADGRELTVGFWGGVCDDYRLTADESGDTVKVEITGEPKKPGQYCIKVAKKLEEKVTLDEPLGDRKVVDARTGKGVDKR